MGSQQSKVTAQDRAVLEMKIQRDKLKQYQRRIQIVLDKETDVARQCLAKGDKRRALLALRQKKYQQGLLEKTDDQLVTLEQLVRHSGMFGTGTLLMDYRQAISSSPWSRRTSSMV